MSRRRFIAGTAAVMAGAAAPLLAQTSQFIVVPFVPTPQVVVDEMLRLAGVTS